MGNNYYIPLDASTLFKYTHLNAPLASLDRAVTYLKNMIVSCDGAITWESGTLTWSGTIRIHFNTAAGLAVQNTITASNVALSDNEFAYVDLSETNDSALTVSKAAITTAAASNFIAYNRLVLGYRNTTSDQFYPVALPFGISSAIIYKTIYIPANAMTPTATAGAALGTAEYATNDINIDYLAFDGASEEFAEFQLAMPEDWDRGTIKAKFFWSSATGSTANDTVEWEIAAGALSNDDAIDAALGTAQVISDTLLADAGADLQVSGATPALTVGGTPALGDLIHFKISRNVGGTDDMTEDAWLFGVWVQYKCTYTAVAW